MKAHIPGPPGWYSVARRTRRWWDGLHWTEDVIHHDRATTASNLRARATVIMWAWVSAGVGAWIIYVVFSIVFGASTAVVLAVLPIVGTASIAASAVSRSRLIAALPPGAPAVSPGRP